MVLFLWMNVCLYIAGEEGLSGSEWQVQRLWRHPRADHWAQALGVAINHPAKWRGKERSFMFLHPSLIICMCVCVCASQRHRAREMVHTYTHMQQSASSTSWRIQDAFVHLQSWFYSTQLTTVFFLFCQFSFSENDTNYNSQQDLDTEQEGNDEYRQVRCCQVCGPGRRMTCKDWIAVSVENNIMIPLELHLCPHFT